MVLCLERDADLHMAQRMPLPLTVSCFSKIQIGFTFLVPAHPGIPGQRAVKRLNVCIFTSVGLYYITVMFLSRSVCRFLTLSASRMKVYLTVACPSVRLSVPSISSSSDIHLLCAA